MSKPARRRREGRQARRAGVLRKNNPYPLDGPAWKALYREDWFWGWDAEDEDMKHENVVLDPEERLKDIVDKAENLLIGIGMGWDTDMLEDALRKAIEPYIGDFENDR